MENVLYIVRRFMNLVSDYLYSLSPSPCMVKCGPSVWCMEALGDYYVLVFFFSLHILDMQGRHYVGTMGSRCRSSSTISCCWTPPPRAQVPVQRWTEVRYYEWAAVCAVWGTLHRAQSSEVHPLKQNIWSAVSANSRKACQVLYFHAVAGTLVERLGTK